MNLNSISVIIRSIRVIRVQKRKTNIAVSLSVQSVKSVVLLFQLPLIATATTIAAAIVAALILRIVNGVLVRFLLGRPRQLCATDGSGYVVASLVIDFRLHVLEAQVVGVRVPLAIHGRIQLTQDTQVRSAMPLATEGTQERCLESPAHRGTAIMQGAKPS